MTPTIRKFTRKPVVVEAVQWTGSEDATTRLKLIRSSILPAPTEWLVRNEGGNFRLLTDTDFRAQYDPLPEEGKTT